MDTRLESFINNRKCHRINIHTTQGCASFLLEYIFVHFCGTGGISVWKVRYTIATWSGSLWIFLFHITLQSWTNTVWRYYCANARWYIPPPPKKNTAPSYIGGLLSLFALEKLMDIWEWMKWDNDANSVFLSISNTSNIKKQRDWSEPVDNGMFNCD